MLENCKSDLKKYFGFDSFKGGQELAVKSIMSKKDCLIIMPTGGGKSICYQLPAVMFEGITIVISPLIALMKDQVDYLNSIGINATYINSSLTSNEIDERIRNIYEGKCKIIYIAPERLDSQVFCQRLYNLKISIVAVDEAHCVSQWGHDFRPSYTRISTFIKGFNIRPIVIALTATATEQVRKDIIGLLELNSPDVHVTGFDRGNLSFSVILGENKRDFLRNYINENNRNSGIIYASTRKEVDNIYEFLLREGYKVGKYHAGMSDLDRIKMQEEFIYDNIDIIVATNAFGMGIDKSNVRYVIHYNMPKNIEAYYQEAGRAGRDGEPGECILLYNPGDLYIHKYFINESNLDEDRKIFEYKKLQTMVDYCYTSDCLRKYILEYFGERNVEERCNNCSICNDNRDVKDITVEAQMILSCVYRTQERYGKNTIIDILKGSENKKILQYSLNKVSTYALMKDYKRDGIQLMMNKLIADGYLKLSEDEFATIKLTSKSAGVLRNQVKVFMKLHKIEKKQEVEGTLLTLLKELRKNISQKEKLPPYVIFHDSTLNEMCNFLPVTEEEFKTIKGVGEVKYNKYGEEFMKIIKNYADRYKGNGIKSNIKQDKIKSHVISYNLYLDGKSFDEIANERGISIVTVENHILDCYLEGYEVDLNSFIPKEYENLILNTITEIGALTLKPIKEVLPEEVSYSAIKAVLYKYKLNEKQA